MGARGGGTPWSGQDGGRGTSGYIVVGVGQGYLMTRSGWGQGAGIPPAQVRMGVAQDKVPPARDGVPTWIGQQREYLLCGRQYASCIHAGGLSSYVKISTLLQKNV